MSLTQKLRTNRRKIGILRDKMESLSDPYEIQMAHRRLYDLMFGHLPGHWKPKFKNIKIIPQNFRKYGKIEKRKETK